MIQAKVILLAWVAIEIFHFGACRFSNKKQPTKPISDTVINQNTPDLEDASPSTELIEYDEVLQSFEWVVK